MDTWKRSSEWSPVFHRQSLSIISVFNKWKSVQSVFDIFVRWCLIIHIRVHIKKVIRIQSKIRVSVLKIPIRSNPIFCEVQSKKRSRSLIFYILAKSNTTSNEFSYVSVLLSSLMLLLVKPYLIVHLLFLSSLL